MPVGTQCRLQIENCPSSLGGRRKSDPPLPPPPSNTICSSEYPYGAKVNNSLIGTIEETRELDIERKGELDTFGDRVNADRLFSFWTGATRGQRWNCVWSQGQGRST